jgi:hypothetical protein
VSSAARHLPAEPALLERLLRSGQLRRADSQPVRGRGARPLSTGVGALDSALGGGLLRGHLTEIVAPPSAGGTALVRAALGAATRGGELCALVDLDDAFHPGGALDEGLPDPAAIDPRRLLWIRPRTLQLALRAAEIAIEARFALVVLDLAGLGTDRAGQRPARSSRVEQLERRLLALPGAQLEAGRERVVRTDRDAPDRPQLDRAARAPQAAGPPWARLARRAEQHGAALLVLARSPQAGAFAAAAIELRRGPARWMGAPGTPGRLLQTALTFGAVSRLKNGVPSAPAALTLRWG